MPRLYAPRGQASLRLNGRDCRVHLNKVEFGDSKTLVSRCVHM